MILAQVTTIAAERVDRVLSVQTKQLEESASEDHRPTVILTLELLLMNKKPHIMRGCVPSTGQCQEVGARPEPKVQI